MRTKIGLRSKVTAFPLFLMLLASLVVFSCAPPSPPTGAVTQPVVGQPAKAGWQQEWDKVVAEGQKEGDLVIVTAASSTARLEITKAFKQRTGITTEWMAGRPAELITRLERERMAGIYGTDLYYGSPEPALVLFAPKGMAAPLPPLLLPEVADPQLWYGGKLPFLDKDRFAFASGLYPFAPLLINTDAVSPGKINSFKDLLKPEWKGKIALNDPSIGVGGGWFHGVIYAKILSPEFMRELAKQEPVITRDFALATEWIARGKYPVLIAPQMTVTAEFVGKGAPIGHVIPNEGVFLWSAMSVVMAFDKAPRPKAGQVFVNWFLSKEGQKLISTVNLIDSARIDIDTGFLPSFLKRQPDVKYFVDTDNEEALKWLPKNMELAKEIFGIR